VGGQSIYPDSGGHLVSWGTKPLGEGGRRGDRAPKWTGNSRWGPIRHWDFGKHQWGGDGGRAKEGGSKKVAEGGRHPGKRLNENLEGRT